MKSRFIAAVLFLTMGTSTFAQAAARTGVVSFGGIQVRVTFDPTKNFLQIGESVYQTKIDFTMVGQPLVASKRVGIMTWNETLQVRLFPNGGYAGGLSSFPCENSFLEITRTDDKGHVTELKAECAYLE
jgi:hypothetical protein